MFRLTLREKSLSSIAALDTFCLRLEDGGLLLYIPNAYWQDFT